MVTINPVSGLPRKQRATSERYYKQAKRPKFSAKMKKLWADPHYREEKLIQLRTFDRPKRPGKVRMGVPDGMRKAEAMARWARAKDEAKRFIKIMEDKGELPAVTVPGSEEEMAKKTLEHAYEMAVGPLTDAKTKAAYLRIVLDFTKAKPESKAKLTLDNSAEWLSALAADMKTQSVDQEATNT